MMIVRVRRAASSSIAARSSCGGGMISRSLLSGSHRVRTPMLASTSRIRLTSSIRARLRSVVLPRLSSEAHRSATAAFLLVLTSMEPESFVPPSIRRCCGPEVPSETNWESRFSPMRDSISRLRFCLPCSMRATALWLVPRSSASSFCVMPWCLRASRMRVPIRARYVSLMAPDASSYVRYREAATRGHWRVPHSAMLGLARGLARAGRSTHCRTEPARVRHFTRASVGVPATSTDYSPARGRAAAGR